MDRGRQHDTTYWDPLALGSAQKVLSDGVGVVAERDLDWALETVYLTVVLMTWSA